MPRRLAIVAVMGLSTCGAVPTSAPASVAVPASVAAPPSAPPRPNRGFSRKDDAGGKTLPEPAHPEAPSPYVDSVGPDDLPGAPLEADFPPCPEGATLHVRRGLWPRTMCVDAAGRPHGPVSLRRGRTTWESGTYSAGLRSGTWTFRYGEDVRVESRFVEGRENGATHTWRGGRLEAEYAMRDGLWHGESWTTTPSGTWRGTYAAGELMKCTAGTCPDPFSGSCAESDIVNVLHAARPALAACYVPGASEQETVLIWKILGDGSTSVPLGSAPGAECLLGVVAALKFSRPRGMLCMVKMGFYYQP